MANAAAAESSSDAAASDAGAHNASVARVRSGTLPGSAASETSVPAEIGSPSGRRSKTSGAVSASARAASARSASAPVSAASASRRAAALRLSRSCARAFLCLVRAEERGARLARLPLRGRLVAGGGGGGRRPRVVARRVRRKFVVVVAEPPPRRAVPPQTRLPAAPRALHVLHGVPVPAPRAPDRRGARGVTGGSARVFVASAILRETLLLG